MVDTRRLGIKFIDAGAYALVITAVVFGLGALLALLVRIRPLLGAKWFMFLVGFVMLAYSALKLRPTPLWKDKEKPSREPVGIQAAVAGALPSKYYLPASERLSVSAKLFVASLSVLATSLAMEVIFGIGIGMGS
ncbi:hypothetical protein E6P09_03385 [Haloferax mediterranei ATCC 33500]|uniref:Uncharacterized protein n=1 Tax=Haloferax mediterranei (strain ATCC 33500 / DSM 1411 / JCM 8866 / NBRC 14739 / NCIMB 2177 / R-4) TaxID=523841 RepID=I3R0P1_HALMT|nr:hypothetical protein [Haloferax mediterranei]AFK17801.1 hypothetical protein HFX_0058 [Haloferax mediterranei ATCC 33500]AHZ22771.1 hypothetical protein BM92_09000 [Haloferax mediterranei ATCC 33500]EMA02928.1 hypothetical protein C439_10105 [Haloferax mediterranei ATCC 33500]MDX5987890.1 hypothetical protein [Haloferax mediterranei ATCC 33500]QCQ74364.1 hypothetical protein E6P09_03385 [Haloferax mediterranei ATCC 33500]